MFGTSCREYEIDQNSERNDIVGRAAEIAHAPRACTPPLRNLADMAQTSFTATLPFLFFAATHHANDLKESITFIGQHHQLPRAAKWPSSCDMFANGKCAPAVILAGVKKCGTNSVEKMLQKHPSVRFPGKNLFIRNITHSRKGNSACMWSLVRAHVHVRVFA